MTLADDIAVAAFQSDEEFRRVLDKVIRKDLGLSKEKFIAVIAARPVLDRISEREMYVDDRRVVIREYAAMTMEDAIIASVRAERDGAQALVCAPIVSYTIEKIVRIPVATIMPTNSVNVAIETASRKIRSQHTTLP